MKRVLIESPFSGDRAAHTKYLRLCMFDSLARADEAPFASHALYTQFLNDQVPAEREHGLQCGFQWGMVAELCAVYVDEGISDGMRRGIALARAHNIPIEFRSLNPNYPPRALAALAASTLAPAHAGSTEEAPADVQTPT